jgi:hypothetical protein
MYRAELSRGTNSLLLNLRRGVRKIVFIFTIVFGFYLWTAWRSFFNGYFGGCASLETNFLHKAASEFAFRMSIVLNSTSNSIRTQLRSSTAAKESKPYAMSDLSISISWSRRRTRENCNASTSTHALASVPASGFDLWPCYAKYHLRNHSCRWNRDGNVLAH